MLNSAEKPSVNGSIFIVEFAMRINPGAGGLPIAAWPKVTAQVHQMPSEFDSNKYIEHRVEATMGKGNFAADVEGICNVLLDLAGQKDDLTWQKLQETDDIIRCPTQEKSYYNDKDESYSSVLSMRSCSEQNFQYPDITKYNNSKGKEKEDISLITFYHFPIQVSIITDNGIINKLHFSENHLRNHH